MTARSIPLTAGTGARVSLRIGADTRLSPAEPFPASLAELDLVGVQVLHSRICCQLDHEYLTDPAGPHPVTLDRRQELVAELGTRAELSSAPAGP